MVHVVAINERTGNQVDFHFKQIVSIDGAPYTASTGELRDSLIYLQARVDQIERIVFGAGQPAEMSQGQQE